MRSIHRLLIGVCVLLGVLSAWCGCSDDDDFSLSPSHNVEFSTDTVAFDTIMTGQATGTYTFQVYNRGKKALRLAQVSLGQGAASPFRVNVDGTFLEGGTAGGFEVRAGDSLRVFLLLNAPENGEDSPISITDNLNFLTEGGARSSVVLTAYGQDVIRLTTKEFTSDTTLAEKRPYHVVDSLVVAQDVVMRVKPGVRFYFHPGAQLIVRGRIEAVGEIDRPIVLRGDRLGYMFSQQPYDRIPGQWGGVVIASSSFHNVMQYCDVHSGEFGIRVDSAQVDDTKLLLEHSVVHNVSGHALSVRSARVFVGNSQITNAGGNCVRLRGGHSTFLHCTIGNFYAFSGGREAALDFSNYDGEVRLPLYHAGFYNSIITGYSADDIMGAQSEQNPDDDFSYLFHHCLLNTPVFEDARVYNCFWDNDEAAVWRDKNFSPAFDLDQLLFIFSLAAESQAVGSADAALSEEFYPYDRMGNSRTLDGAPDLGCYELVQASEE